jgi:hypothetical protein
MLRSLRDKFGAIGTRLDLRPYLVREPVMLALLFTVAVVLFLAVSGLSRVYHAQQMSLGNRWFARGVVDLKQQRFGPAVNEFRMAGGVLTLRHYQHTMERLWKCCTNDRHWSTKRSTITAE